MAANEAGEARSSDPVDAKIEAVGGWRGAMLWHVRALIRQADPEISEEIKWRKPTNPSGVPVWSHGGIICTGETYKDKVKLTFAQGAALEDPAGLFSGKDNGATRRSIDIFEGDRLDEPSFVELVRSAVRLNLSKPRR